MRNERAYQILVSKMQEVSMLPPQRLGPFTTAYRQVSMQLKYAPWRMGILVSFLLSFLLYLFLGTALIRIVSILQYGF